MKYKLYTLITLVFLSCSKNVDTDGQIDQIEETFQDLLNEAVYGSFEEVPGVSMTVLAPDLGVIWSGVSGFDSKERADSLKVNQPFRIASVTKTFVAAAILRLHEIGKLSLDDPIGKYISNEHKSLLQKDGYQIDEITLLQILNHTNGLYDYAVGGRTYLETIVNDPKRVWTRTDQLRLAMETGNPVGKPGEKYVYNDTGYILAGETIENLVDSTLAYGLRSLLDFKKLGLNSTWLESIEPHLYDSVKKVRRYAGKYDMTAANPSIDLYGGGGLVSTTEDLANFIHALFSDQVFENQETMSLMLQKASYATSYDPLADDRYEDYRLGLWEFEIYGVKAYMHDGFWGTAFIHVPEYNCSIAVNYTYGYGDRLMKKALLAVKNIHDNMQN
ncbi:MAG: serine hydrolase domain-containing protein [Bacteroidota bacterium]